MSRSALLGVLLAAAAALTVAGCGPAASSDSSKDFQGAKADVAKVVDDLSAAAQKRDGGKICKELLAPSLLQGFTTRKQVCKTVMKDDLTDADTFGMKVKSVTILPGGAKATAVVESDTGLDGSKSKQLNTFTFVKDAGANGAWKVSGFGG